MFSKLKNYRLTDVSIRHLAVCRDRFELPSDVAVIKVALQHLYDSRKDLNGWEIFQNVQRKESRTRKNSNSKGT